MASHAAVAPARSSSTSLLPCPHARILALDLDLLALIDAGFVERFVDADDVIRFRPRLEIKAAA